MIEFITKSSQWREALADVGEYDFYHTYDYHQLGQNPGETAALLRFKMDTTVILLPIMLRTVPAELQRPDLQDANSVYGYTGPLVRGETVELKDVFHSALSVALRERGIVSVFSRLHPLFDHSELLIGLGRVVTAGATVSVDLTLPLESQRAAYRQGTKNILNKLQRNGAKCLKLPWTAFGDVFVSIYEETMHRVKAQKSYFFPRAYYDHLFKMDGVETHLFGCFQGEELVCAGLFTVCNGIVEYHLSGTRESALRLDLSRLMLDTVRLWAVERGAHIFHLGGGLGGQRDSLFEFKAGFSKREHDFKLWKWVVDIQAYNELCHSSKCSVDSAFFPAYRTSATIT